MTELKALELLKEYTTKPNLIKHALAVSAAMKHFAALANQDPQYWAVVGLLHDIDYELHPDCHCHSCVGILHDHGVDDDVIHAVQSHGFGLCCDVEPILYMEKVLCAVDQLTGFIIACALIRPEKKLELVTLESIKKRWPNKAFAAGTQRERIEQYCEKLGYSFDYVAEQTLIALQAVADELGL